MAKIRNKSIYLVFAKPLKAFYLSAEEARVWASGLIELADALDQGEE